MWFPWIPARRSTLSLSNPKEWHYLIEHSPSRMELGPHWSGLAQTGELGQRPAQVHSDTARSRSSSSIQIAPTEVEDTQAMDWYRLYWSSLCLGVGPWAHTLQSAEHDYDDDALQSHSPISYQRAVGEEVCLKRTYPSITANLQSMRKFPRLTLHELSSPCNACMD